MVAAGTITAEEREEASSLVLQDVTSHTLGILVNTQDFHRLIPKESRIPIEKRDDNFINAGPSQSIDVLIFQGENDIAYDNALIGKLPIPLPEAREKGYWHFAVTFKLNNDGILNVQVERLNDKVSFEAKVQCSLRAGASKVEQSSEHLAQVMAGGGDSAAVPPPHPPPPPAPARAAAAAAAAPPRLSAVEPPPPGVPDEFRPLARRCCKLLEQPMDAAKRELLLKAYNAFVEAVKKGQGDVEDLGDSLDEVYRDCRQ
jgi:molecular chaperone DnaK